LKDQYYQWVKEISKIYNEIVTVQTTANIEVDQFDPGIPDINDASVISGYIYDDRLGQRFSPCGGPGGGTICLQPPSPWIGEDTQTNEVPGVTGPGDDHNASKNIPYYYFGLNPGKTAIEKLRKQFFVN